jgi:hypothetical protein
MKFQIGLGSQTSAISNTYNSNNQQQNTQQIIGKVYGVITTLNTPTKEAFEANGGFNGIGTIFYLNYDETSNLNNSDSSYYKEGGMATPLMAEGGQVPHYYTYGKPVDPKEILAGMAKGGEAQKGGLPTHVPTIEGRHDYRSGSRVSGDGDGTSDDIPAMLADGEYVFSADVVSALGNGSTKAGADRLDHMVEQIRARDRSTHPSKLPPDAKSPLQYLKQSRSK